MVFGEWLGLGLLLLPVLFLVGVFLVTIWR